MAPRKALVTGGTGAIGTEICRALAADGHRVAALGHPSESDRIADWRRKLADDGVDVTVSLCDLTDFDGTAAALQDLQEPFGRVDILVNAAGITRDARLVKMTPEHWRAVLSTNLDSVFNATKPLFDGMCQRGWGRIVNLSSVNGQKGQFGQANYAAAKAGMHGFTMSVAQEGAAKGVTVNTVSPGYVETPMTAAIKPEALAAVLAQIPVQRMARPQEIARVVAFLCAEDAGYITGTNIAVNGGLHMGA